MLRQMMVHPNSHERLKEDSPNQHEQQHHPTPSNKLDKWTTAYRALGTYIDCGTTASQEGASNTGNNVSCTRYMIWAAYHNPEIGSNHPIPPNNRYQECQASPLWMLVGVYRTQLVSFLQAAVDHMWPWNSYATIVIQASLGYLSEADSGCFPLLISNQTSDEGCSSEISSTSNSSSEEEKPPEVLNSTLPFVGIAPQPQGKFQLALYDDDQCSMPSNEAENPDSLLTHTPSPWDEAELNDWWNGSQEYTLKNMNQVVQQVFYDSCNLCIDVPSYSQGQLLNTTHNDTAWVDQCYILLTDPSTVPCDIDDCLSRATHTIRPITVDGFRFGVSDVIPETGTEERRALPGTIILLLLLAILSFGAAIALTVFTARRKYEPQKRTKKEYEHVEVIDSSNNQCVDENGTELTDCYQKDRSYDEQSLRAIS